MKTRLFLLLCLVTLIPALGASAATILGVVVDSSNGSPLSGATVVLRGQNAQTMTNFNGQFRITAPDGTLYGFGNGCLAMRAVHSLNLIFYYTRHAAHLLFAMIADECDNQQGCHNSRAY